MEYGALNINRFDGGLNEVGNNAMIADNESSELINFELSNSKAEMQTRRGNQYWGSAGLSGNPVTSIFAFCPSANPDNPSLLLTYRDFIYGALPGEFSTSGFTLTRLNSSVATGNTTFWFWDTMNDTAIGVNGQTGGGYTNPIKWTGTSYAVSALSSNAPKGKYIEIWNSRCWIVDGTNPNRLYFSKVGDSTDWTTTGVSGAGYIDVGYNDGEIITGIVAHRERLFIFKRSFIYQIITANPNTDNTLWRLELFTKEGGCSQPKTIQIFNNDVIFLSDDGYVSLNIVLAWGDFKRGIISHGLFLGDIYPFPNVWAAASVVYPEKSQYWTSYFFGSIAVLSVNKEGAYVWSRFQFASGQSGSVAPSALAVVRLNYLNKIVMASATPLSDGATMPIYFYPNQYATEVTSLFMERFDNYAGFANPLAFTDAINSPDGVSAYEIRLRTKMFDLDEPTIRKRVNKFAATFRNYTTQDNEIWLTVGSDRSVANYFRGKLLLKGYSEELLIRDQTFTRKILRKPPINSVLFEISAGTLASTSISSGGFGIRALSIDIVKMNRKHTEGHYK